MPRQIHSIRCFPLVLAALLPWLVAADWAQFRGGQRFSISPDSKLPKSWDESNNVAWRADLPGRGPSSPVVAGDRVFVTASSGVKQERLHILCFDMDSGRQLWHRQFWATGRTLCHPTSANAAPTPATNGEVVVAFFSSSDLVCLDVDGNLRWYRGLGYDYPKSGNDVGMSSSPLIVDDTVVVQIESQSDSFAAGIDLNDGQQRWRVKRDRQANWSSPVFLPGTDRTPPAVLLQSPAYLSAHDPHSGNELWRFDGSCDGIASAVTFPGCVLLPISGGLILLKSPEADGEPEIVWETNRLKPTSASPIAHAGKVFAVNRGGILVCADGKTGDSLWTLRMGGTYWATPIVSDGHMFCMNQDGDVKVVDLAAEKGRIVAANKFDSGIQGSPAVSRNAMFVRTDTQLWKIASTN
jgi:outer membrane protein assembly factor BamB